MAPHHPKDTAVPSDTSSSDGDVDVAKGGIKLKPTDLQPASTPNKDIPMEIVWFNVYNMTVLHLLATYGAYLAVFHATWGLLGFSFALYILGGLGITAGAHRLWAHKSYSATTPLRVFLMLCQTLAGQDNLHQWSRDHRVHHKWSETNADPYNANRGMFFAHMGWLLIKKHPDVVKYGNKLDYSDLLNDPVVRFQKKYYIVLYWLIVALMPTVIGHYYFGAPPITAFCVAGIARYVFTLHMTWLVNSLAHYYGMRPYDKGMNPAENRLVSLGAIGEGFHNFHHCFPQDYQASEMGYSFNISTMFIDLMAACGLAYDLHTASKDMINKRKERTGDPTNKRELFSPTYGADHEKTT